MKLFVWVIIVSLECIIFTLCVVRMLHGSTNVLGSKTHAFPIQKKALVFPTNSLFPYFYEYEPNTTVVESASWLDTPGFLTINSDSLIERFDYTHEKPAGVYRIITLGDSFTEGMYVDAQYNWTELLEDKLNSTYRCNGITHFEVINLGVSGYDMRYVFERFVRRGIAYLPDAVLFLTFNNDYTIVNHVYQELIPQFEQLLATQSSRPIDPVLGRRRESWDYAAEAYYKTHTIEESIREQLPYFQKLSHMISGPFIIAGVTSFPSFLREHMERMTLFRPDTYYYFQLPPSYPAFPDGHPNKEGHALFADQFYSFLTSNRSIFCK